ncbi:hypothetical protein [Gemmatimonas aurantiaca]|uniref:hypothetical protein n=1 Tax=Gemmatimonas aurantiaca TaxID=173480 RepID=UPI00301D82D1
MKKPLLLLSLGLLTIACGDQTAPRADFEITTTVSQDVARVGEEIRVTVTATNISGRVQEILTNDCIQAFQVRDAAGRQVGPAGRSCLLVASRQTLAPGASYTITQGWVGDAVGPINAPPPKVEPGVYTIEGQLRLGEHVRVTPVTVRLLP